MEVKQKLKKFYRWEYFWLFLIVITSLALHFAVIAYPSTVILDEVHYISDARTIINDHATHRVEHPPLAKLLITGGILLFGDNPWGWRVLPVLFGTITVMLFYLLCRRLEMTRTASSIAAFLLAFENLFFMLSSLAMLDVYCLTFMMASFLLYVSRRYISSGVAVGLSTLAKLNGAFSGLAIILHWIFSVRQGRTRLVMYTVIFAIVVFVGLMPFFDFAIVREFTGFLNPFKRIVDMLGLTGGLTFAFVDHPSEAPPWEWLYTYKPMPFNYMPHYSAAISFSVWALIVPVLVYLIYRAVKKDEAGLFGLTWLFAAYLVWIPSTIVTQRVTYLYYFYPAVGAVCLGLGMALNRLLDIFKSRSGGKLKWFCLSVVIFVLAVHVFSFIVLSPLVPVDFFGMVGINTTQP